MKNIFINLFVLFTLNLYVNEIFSPNKQILDSLKIVNPIFLDIQSVNKSLFKNENYKVLFFYPFDFTFVCPTEILSFDELLNEFKELNVEVFGISQDSPHSHYEFMKKSRLDGGLQGIKYSLISDFDKLLVKYMTGQTKPVRALFILNEKNLVRHIQINDLQVGRNVDEVLRIINAFKYSDKYGENCPSKWKNFGDKSIGSDHKKKQDYFSDL